MTKPLLVVESPTKVRTLKKYIGKDYNIVATLGHIMDLPVKEFGIDIQHNFTPQYKNIPGKQKVITSLKMAADGAEDIFLAPDPDREGEAIAWHTSTILKKEGRRFHRVLFHELTRRAILEALASPEALNRHKYDAQQARRILDRIVGYEISPLLWRKVKSGLSAGRVQSVAVRIVCERERAIQAFKTEEYWSITAHLEGHCPPPFTAKLVKKNQKKIHIPDQKTADGILNELSGAKFIVDKVLKKTTRRNPLPPFITSKLQQEAIRKLRFTAKKTMMIAQQLYEGIELGPGEPVGLITYMRTDSTRISPEAAQEAIDLIRQRFGREYAMEKPRFFKNKKKVQDAHEAIRPSSVFNTPESIAPYLSRDQLALYTTIWQRFVASQMEQARINNNLVSISAGPYTFNASGSQVVFPGFMALYLSVEDQIESEKSKEMLPELSEGLALKLNQLEPKQHFTMPPPRFSEASLVKELEENGIGRPSTYAAILSTIREKGYVEFIKGYFVPSELGFIVNDLLVDNFSKIFNVDFTSRMEGELDRLEAAEVDVLNVLTGFYDSFKKDLDAAKTGMLTVKGVGFPTDLLCPQCRQILRIKVGKKGPFLSCSGYPECKYSRNYDRDEQGKINPVAAAPVQVTDDVCGKCGRPMLVKDGKFGPFLACSGYPECKSTRSLNGNAAGDDTGANCPEKGCNGKLVGKTSRRGKKFFGCSSYPACNFALWDKPVPRPCPGCGAGFLVEKSTKKEGVFLACLDKTCGYKEKAGSEETADPDLNKKI
ncbi:MAG: type I DNA topoisomerase [Desulfobacterales bacterium]|nr:type I DNA topoisomerase [Desulfobacterales bacterium]